MLIEEKILLLPRALHIVKRKLLNFRTVTLPCQLLGTSVMRRSAKISV